MADDQAELACVAVHPHYRRWGYGDQLVKRIEARGVRARVAASYRERHVLLRRRDPSARGRARRVAPLRWREKP